MLFFAAVLCCSLARRPLARLEGTVSGRIGVYALDTGTGRSFGYRANERFAFCSTSKLIIVGATLDRRELDLGRVIRYGKKDHVAHSPIADMHQATGMTVHDLCAAALDYSDNTAANLLIHLLGGPAAVTRFARSIGDKAFRLNRAEPALNTAIPGDPRDTTQPKAMAQDLKALVLGTRLSRDRRKLLRHWLLANTTGGERIRAATPKGWLVGDKTGTGDYGVANDVAILWPPHRAPILLTVFTTRNAKRAEASSAVVAAATKLALRALN